MIGVHLIILIQFLVFHQNNLKIHKNNHNNLLLTNLLLHSNQNKIIYKILICWIFVINNKILNKKLINNKISNKIKYQYNFIHIIHHHQISLIQFNHNHHGHKFNKNNKIHNKIIRNNNQINNKTHNNHNNNNKHNNYNNKLFNNPNKCNKQLNNNHFNIKHKHIKIIKLNIQHHNKLINFKHQLNNLNNINNFKL